ncbi:MAG: AAA family ATPase [Prevotella sp.]|nr:AAA family ATPase [Prevotella sp.]MCI7482852.1 AAA family ATPase [Prevotella sp.]MDY2894519.1 AAA family ATPase [Prevotella sp.]MDY3620231.1 AAA family ATPase [Prevotella sp.]MDY4804323.1 AAA family ATPase [Prevotella sp.]
MEKREDKPVQLVQKSNLEHKSLEVSMLEKDDFSDEELESYLSKGEIKATDKVTIPPKILFVGDCTIATFGNFSASTGKAKSKKTFNISAMVAAAVTNTTVLNYRACLPEGKRKILYFDTEQSKYHCHNVLERIYKLSGLSVKKDDPRLLFWGLREYTPKLRIALIDYALRKHQEVGLVIIDGLRDLMYDINNGKEATDVMTVLMAWTSVYDLHIHTVLHLNKNDNNPRGHIGTELENKAETVLIISKNLQNNSISEVRPMHMRDKEFSTFAFHIDDNKLPVLDNGISVTVVKRREKSLVSLDNEVHQEILSKAFKNNTPTRYSDLVEMVSRAYEDAGYKRGTNGIKDLLKLLSGKGIIVKQDDAYIYKSEGFVNPSTEESKKV